MKASGIQQVGSYDVDQEVVSSEKDGSEDGPPDIRDHELVVEGCSCGTAWRLLPLF